MIKFFKWNNNELEINKEELYLLPSAKALVQADKGGFIHGDYDGRKKLMATKQLGLAWWIININSPGIQNGLEKDELIRDGIKSLGIPVEWKYKDDVPFNNFVKEYGRMYNSSSYIRLLKSLLIAFADSSTIVDAMRTQVKLTLSNKDNLDAEDMKILVAAQNQIMTIAGQVPEHIKKMKELENIVYKEEKEKALGRGDRIITDSMNPDK